MKENKCVHDTDEFITMNTNNHMYVCLVSFKHVMLDFTFYWTKTFLTISIVAICYRNLFDLFLFKTVLYQINERNWKIVVTVTMNTLYTYTRWIINARPYFMVWIYNLHIFTWHIFFIFTRRNIGICFCYFEKKKLRYFAYSQLFKIVFLIGMKYEINKKQDINI